MISCEVRAENRRFATKMNCVILMKELVHAVFCKNMRDFWRKCGSLLIFPLSLPTRGAWIEMRSKFGLIRQITSLPTRGAWIEIPNKRARPCACKSLPTRGAWIEIPIGSCRATKRRSLPTRGAWIEIGWDNLELLCRESSLPTRGAWIEITATTSFRASTWSLPTRGAWIEIGAQKHIDHRAIRRSPHGERGLK